MSIFILIYDIIFVIKRKKILEAKQGIIIFHRHNFHISMCLTTSNRNEKSHPLAIKTNDKNCSQSPFLPVPLLNAAPCARAREARKRNKNIIPTSDPR